MNITRDYAATIEDVSTQERMVTARINTGSIDRFRTVIDPAGGDLTKYNKVVLWEHGKDPQRGSLPIGKNTWIKRVGGEIRARTQFGKDDYSQCLFDMYKDGMLNGWSVNVLPTAGSYGPPTKEERRQRPELERCDTVYRQWELAEYSAVAVPGNSDALTLLESRGIWFPDEARGLTAPSSGVKTIGDAAPEGETPEEDDAEHKCIKKCGAKWRVYSDDGERLGEHDSRDDAVKQLAACKAGKQDAGRSLLTLRRELASDFSYMETRLMTRMRDLGDLLKGRV